MAPEMLTAELKNRARQLGFTLSGACPAVSPPGLSHLDQWLARGYAGDMHYLEERREAYAHPRHVLEGARSVLMLALNYRTAEPAPPSPGQGRVARYAWGSLDYHDLIRPRLHHLADYLCELAPAAQARGIVDTAPLNEREFAQLAGLGWVGKNTLLLNRNAGSYFFLAALLTDQELAYDSPHATDHCGTCTACLDACPTGAFPAPYVLDASRCISYLTIEQRGMTPTGLRPGVGEWLFGCDVCQEVCPWNRHAPPAMDSEFAPLEAMNPIDLCELFDLSDGDFRRRFRRTPLWRPHRRGLLRNAALVLGNQGHAPAIPALAKGLNDAEPLVRAACVWAVGQLAHASSTAKHVVSQLLAARVAIEDHPEVQQEIIAALTATTAASIH